MLITPQNFAFFFSALDARFSGAYDTAPLWYERLATVVPSATEQHVFGWIGMSPKAREWVGPREVHASAPQTYTVSNQLFELTESIDKFKLMDDSYGIYFPKIANMGKQMAKVPDYQLRDLLKNQGSQTGARQKGLDGLNHWATNHPVDYYDASKGTYCNDFIGGVSINSVTVGGALGTTAYSTLWAEFASRKSESGEALGVIPDLTVVPPQLDITAKTILNAQFFAAPTIGNLTGNVGSTENMLKGSTDLLMVPDFAGDPTVWYMADTKHETKPFLWLEREATQLTQRINPEDPSVFDSHTFLYGAYRRGTPAWSHAWLSARSGA